MAKQTIENHAAEVEALRQELAQLKRDNEERNRFDLISNTAMKEALKQNHPEDEINCFLASIGRDLEVDRIYIFEDDLVADETSNTYEWCAPGVNPEIENLQDIPRTAVTWWYERFEQGNDIRIPNLEAIKDSEPITYAYLAPQGIYSLIAKRLILGDTVVGFFGVDNPRIEFMADISVFLDTLSNFLSALIQHRNIFLSHESRYIAQLEEKNIALNKALKKTEESEEKVARLAEFRNTMITVTHEALHSGMWSINFNEKGEMTSVDWSQEFRRMIGYHDLNDFPNKLESWTSLIHPEDRDYVLEEFYETIEDYANKKSFDVGYRLLVKRGQWRWFHSMGRLIRQSNGAPQTYIGVFVDITDQKNQTQLLADALQEAKEANSAKSDFLSNMSHDIRTPMNAIIGMTAIAEDHIDDRDRVQDCLHKISLAGKHLLGLINDVLDMSKIESGKMNLHIEDLSLREVMNSICGITRMQIKDKTQHLDIFVTDILSEVIYCDSVRLSQILLNLLSNAIKFTPANGSIQIRLWQEPSPKGEGYVLTHFSVSDTGIGMSPQFMSTIFEAFTREDAKRVQKTQGTGLGMAITKKIVDLMGGSIQVSSELDKGTTFHVTLDLQRANQSCLQAQLPPWNILILDQSEEQCRTASQWLEEMGTCPSWCTNEESALSLYSQALQEGREFQLLILDPRAGGLKVLEKIQGLSQSPKPMVTFSSYDWSELQDMFEGAEVSGHISKPMFKSSLFEELCQLTAQDEQTASIQREQELINLGGMHILLAEDNDVNAEIALMILEEMGATAQRTEDGVRTVEAFESAPVGSYDAILMDLRMPHMDGLQATRTIRALPREDAKTIPIIAMTADAFAEDAQRCLDAGMNAHLAKPIDVEQLKKTLKRYQ